MWIWQRGGYISECFIYKAVASEEWEPVELGCGLLELSASQ